VAVLDVSERCACRVLGQPRSTPRYAKQDLDDEEILTERIVALASQYGRYGYQRVTGLLRNEGWIVNHKRAGSIVRLRPEFPKHVWSYDFLPDRTHNGLPFRILNVIDEYTRECLAVRMARRLTHKDVLEVLPDLFCEKGVPGHIRSGNGSEFTAKRVRHWLARLAVRPLFIEPGSPWQNGYIESFNGKMRNEFLAREIFSSVKEAQLLIEMWRRHYNTIRPPSSLGYRPPAPATFVGHPTAFQAV
jgi:transposase InsO family protein